MFNSSTIESWNFYFQPSLIDIASEVQNITSQINVSIIDSSLRNEFKSTEQTINQLKMVLCNSTYNMPYINYTFKDETSDVYMNASIASSEYYYSLISDISLNRSLSHSNTTTHNSYAFCYSVTNTTAYLNSDISYKAEGYAQRRYRNASSVLTNATDNVILYLVSTADGSYTTFQVLTAADQPIENVYSTMERVIGGNYQLLESKYTDASGGVTFWVNPDYSYRFTFSKSGYDTFTTILTPTQSSYTITLVTGAAAANVTYVRGVDYVIEPHGNMSVLNNGTEYNFSFTTSSRYWALDETGFILTNYSDDNLGSDSCSGDTGCSASVVYNTGAQEFILMRYYWIANQSYQNGTHIWSITHRYVGNASLFQFFEDLKKLEGEAGFDDFTKGLLSFFFIFMVTGVAVYISDMRSPLAVLAMIFAATAFLDIVGFLPAFGDSLVAEHFITGIIGALLLGYVIYEYQISR